MAALISQTNENDKSAWGDRERSFEHRRENEQQR
jgi:hypothetical protein